MFGDVAFSGYSVHDLAAAEDFYGNQLDLRLDKQPGMGFSFSFASGQKVFIYPKPDHTAADFTVLNFVVDDIDAAVDTLERKGIHMKRYDTLPAPQDSKGILRGRQAGYGPDIAWFTDPAGNVLSVLQDK